MKGSGNRDTKRNWLGLAVGALLIGFGWLLFQKGFNGQGSYNHREQHYYTPRDTMLRGVGLIVFGAVWFSWSLRKQNPAAHDNPQDALPEDGSPAPDKISGGLPQTTWGRVRRWVMPSYDETTLFLMAVTCLALVVADSELREQIARCFDPGIKGAILYSALFGMMILGGLILSLYHAFSAEPASRVGKYLMCVFAMGVNGIGGIACGLELGHSCQGWQMVFPVWNMVCGATLLYRIGWIDDPEEMVSDGRPSMGALLFGLLLLAILFHHCHFVSNTGWALTFSICVAYSTSISHVVRKLALMVISRS